jgi:anti-anti-sigma factor
MNSKPTSQDEMPTLRVAGDLTSTNADSVGAEISRIFDRLSAGLAVGNLFRLDLTAAKMVDSVGLNLVVALLKRLQKHGAKLQVAYSNQNVFRTFAFTRLDKHIELVKV